MLHKVKCFTPTDLDKVQHRIAITDDTVLPILFEGLELERIDSKSNTSNNNSKSHPKNAFLGHPEGRDPNTN